MSSTTISTPQDERRGNLIRIAQLAAFLTLPIAVYDVYLGLLNGITNRTVYFLLAAGILTLLFITSVVIIRTRHAEKQTLGTWHLLTLLSFSFLLSSALQSNVGADMGAALLIISMVISIQTLPSDQVPRGAILGAIASLLASLLAFYSPLPQEVDPRIDTVTIWVVRGATVAVLGIAVTQFRILSISNKLLISFLGVVVLISLTFNIVTTATASKSMTNQVGLSLQSVAQSRSAVMGDYLQSQVEILQTFALDETIRQSLRQANALKPTLDSILVLDEQWRQAVESGTNNSLINSRLTNSLSSDLRAFQELTPDHVEVFITDQAGALVATTNVTSDYYQADEAWWLVAYAGGNGDIFISQPELDESAGIVSILMAVPIYDTRQGDLIGILRSTIAVGGLVEVVNEPIGETGDIDIYFPDRTMLDMKDAAYEVVSPKSLTAVQDSINQIYIRSTFEENDSIVSQAKIQSRSNTSKVNELNWSVIVSQHTIEALAPVNHQVRLSSFFGTIMAGIAALLSIFVSQRLSLPINTLTEAANKISEGDYTAHALVTSEDEIGMLSQAFNSMTAQLQASLLGLEQRVAERTAELEKSSEHLQKRAAQFQTIAQLARTISTMQDLNSLLTRVTQLVSKQFGFYHAGLFLLDESNKYAVLSAANSEGGQRMLARKHRLGVGQIGIVGYVTATGNPRIALDTGADAVYFDNPDMPDTRSEMALPLRVGKKIIGALDVQSTEQNAFSEDDIEVLSILADVVSVAIENARLFEESQRVLADAQSAYGDFTKVAWNQVIGKRKSIGYIYSGTAIRPLEDIMADNKQSTQTKTDKTANNNKELTIPIKLRDQVIGTMNIGLPENRDWDPDELDITQALAQRVSIAIENATLLEESRRRAARESMIGEISAKISATAEVKRIMQIAVEELRQALGASEVSLNIGSENNEETNNEA